MIQMRSSTMSFPRLTSVARGEGARFPWRCAARRPGHRHDGVGFSPWVGVAGALLLNSFTRLVKVRSMFSHGHDYSYGPRDGHDRTLFLAGAVCLPAGFGADLGCAARWNTLHLVAARRGRFLQFSARPRVIRVLAWVETTNLARLGVRPNSFRRAGVCCLWSPPVTHIGLAQHI